MIHMHRPSRKDRPYPAATAGLTAAAAVLLFALPVGADHHRSAADERMANDLIREPISLVVLKQRRELGVYQFGRLKNRYPIVLGRNPVGHKLYEGDMRTPEGFYRVANKRDHARWRHFIAIDYPNSADRRTYRRAVGRGFVPKIDGTPLGIGSGLGIHGNHDFVEQNTGVDWTKGCVAMDNDDLHKIYSIVERGTPVLILEGEEPIADDIRAMIDSRRAVSTADTQ